MKLFVCLVLICASTWLRGEDPATTSKIQGQITELTSELKKLNTELKKITGPETEKQVTESKKKRQERQKEGERRLKERRSSGSGSYYPSSSRGSSHGYGDYSPSSYGHSGYGASRSPSRGKSSFDSWDSDFGSGKADKGKESSKDSFGKSSSDDKLKLEDTDKKKKGGFVGSNLKKDEKSAVTKIKNYTDEIKESLKQVLRQLDEVQTSQQKTIEAREKIYSDFFGEGDTLSELEDSLRKRKEAVKSLSKELAKKHAAINTEERSLWGKILPHLTRMLVFVPEFEDTEPISSGQAGKIRNLIKNLEKDKLVSPGSVKSDQAKVESEIVERLRKLKTPTSDKKGISEENQETITAIEQRIRNLRRPVEHAELKGLGRQPKKTRPEMKTQE